MLNTDTVYGILAIVVPVVEFDGILATVHAVMKINQKFSGKKAIVSGSKSC